MNVELRVVEGDREAFLPLLLEADESEEMVRTYLKEGELLAVEVDGTTSGEMLVIPLPEAPKDTWEIQNIAIAEEHRGKGIGRRAIDLLASRAAANGTARLLVGTADIAWETHRFYLRSGFRYAGVRRDFFDRYPEPLLLNGMVVRDMVLFDRPTSDGPFVRS
ncbi:MAG: GNAT family N-acetyltransferase [Actinomycetota bacterium]